VKISGISINDLISRPFAEKVERFFKQLDFRVDLLFPTPHVPKAKIYGSLAMSGVMYVIIIDPSHVENNSLSYVVSSFAIFGFGWVGFDEF
jgi:hypothetical protein